MSVPCTIVIAARHLIPRITARIASNGEVMAFAEEEALHALEAIGTHRPRRVALQQLFAASPRGAALVMRIKADPTLANAEILLLSDEGDELGPAAAPPAAQAPPIGVDQRGTRRAPRVRMPASVGALVDGNQALLVDLSTLGAQVVSPGVLRPNQRVRLVLPREEEAIRLAGVVAWAKFEMGRQEPGPKYRAGIEFVNDPDTAAIERFCTPHKVKP